MPFNTLLLYCRCGLALHFQTKADVPYKGQFTLSEVPMDMADALDGRQRQCPRCDATLTLSKLPVNYVPMQVDFS